MTEEERIMAIRESGGQYLKELKPENITYTLCFEAVSIEGTALQFVPQEYLTEEMCFNAVCTDPQAFRFVPEDILTPEFCAKVISQKEESWIRSLPDSNKNTSFYMAILDIVPKVFWYLPKRNRTASVCRKALRNMGFNSTAEAVHCVPQIFGLLHPALYDHDSCLEFVKSEYFKNWTEMRPERGSLSSIIGNELKINDEVIQLDRFLRYYDVCIEAVQANRFFIQAVPPEMMSEELCEKAIIADGYSFRFIPEEYLTERICELAFKYDPYNLEKIPDKYKTPSMCLEAVKKSGFLLGAVPDAIKTHEMCVIAVSDHASGLDYVPEVLFDKEIALLAINNPPEHGPLSLNRIPERLRDYEVCEAAVFRMGGNLAYVTDGLKDYKLCLSAVQHGFHAVKYVPYECFTPELVLMIAQRSTSDFKWIPKDRLTKEACLEAVKHRVMDGGTVIGEIPLNLITQEMCDISIGTSIHSFSKIPDEYVTEDMLVYVGEEAPGLLQDNFPRRFRTKERIEQLSTKCPSASAYFRSLI